LPPASSVAVAVPTLEEGGEWDPEFQQQARPRAKRITLEEGQELPLDLQLPE
jgi:hypothetical protein